MKSKVCKVNAFSLWLIVLLLSTIGCGISNDKLIEQYNAFAIRSARANLWNESILRWQRIIEIDPKNAKAHNNLAVAYEAMERFDEAQAEYKKAIELDPDNDVYQRNFFNCQKNKGTLNIRRGMVKKDEDF
jgi:tetratricopeptide (TPR) repeat protein